MKPDLSEDAFLRRHQNPLGMKIRAGVILALVIGAWFHALWLVLLALLVEAANWLYCPPVDTPPEWVERIIDAELAFLDRTTPGQKTLLAGIAIFGLGLFFLGIAMHHLPTFAIGLAVAALPALILYGLARRG